MGLLVGLLGLRAGLSASDMDHICKQQLSNASLREHASRSTALPLMLADKTAT